MHARTPEKGAVTPKETDPDFPVSVQQFPSGGGVGQQRPAAGSGALSAPVHEWDLLMEVAIIFITSAIVWSQVKQQGGNTAPAFKGKLD